MYQLGDPPNYEPVLAAESMAARARCPWASRLELVYDLLLTNDGQELLNSPILNYTDGNLDAAYEMLADPITAFGLGDGGAQRGPDLRTQPVSSTTFLLSYWARDRIGQQLGLEAAVHKMTGVTADLYDLGDRGRLVPGSKGDVNVIDHQRLQLHRPAVSCTTCRPTASASSSAPRYVATINAGTVVMAEGEETGVSRGWLGALGNSR